MSKLITTRYEYATYDDAANGANLTALPPVYPTPLDQYVMDTVASAAQSYGMLNVGLVSSAGNVPLNAPQGASLLVCAPLANTANVVIKTQAAAPTPLTPGGATQTLFWTVMPGQTVSVPGVFNATSSPLIAFAVDSTNAALTATWNLQVLWSL